MLTLTRLKSYAFLMRVDKPVGSLLLLWPTWWALWLAAQGLPDPKILIIFTLGVFLMRSAGCVINDLTDRNIDGQVWRTQYRPLPSKLVQVKEAVILALTLVGCAFLMVLFCSKLTIELAFIGLLLTIIYPFMKRIAPVPQLILGMAFAWGVPMAFMEIQGVLTYQAWLVYFTALIWPIIYDTMYAMVDREDDLKVKVKSSAILLGRFDRIAIGFLQVIFIVCLLLIGHLFDLHFIYYVCINAVVFFFVYQQFLIKDRKKEKCFQAFSNNVWVGLFIFIGIALGMPSA